MTIINVVMTKLCPNNYALLYHSVSPEHSVTVSTTLVISNLGDNVTLVCFAMGGPGNSFQWEINGTVAAIGSNLTLLDIDASYGGNYSCIVRNPAGYDSASTMFFVTPYIVTPLEEDILAVNGSTINVSCDAAGFPTPTVNWVGVLDLEISSTMMLQFSPVTFDDKGVYHCVAFSEINGTNYTTTDQVSLNGN